MSIIGDVKIRIPKKLTQDQSRVFFKETARALEITAIDIERDAKANLVKNKSIGATGLLRTSIFRGRPKRTATGMSVKVGSPQLYALPVEKGRGRNKTPPPTDAIEQWLRSVRGRGFAFFQKKTREGGEKVSPPQTDKQWKFAASRLAQAIGSRGIKAKPFLLPALQGNLRKLRNRMQKILLELF